MSNTPLRDKLVQIEHDTFDAACSAGKGYVEARYAATLAVKQYEEQSLARLALYPELVDALKALTVKPDDTPAFLGALAVLVQAERIEKGE